MPLFSPNKKKEEANNERAKQNQAEFNAELGLKAKNSRKGDTIKRTLNQEDETINSTLFGGYSNSANQDEFTEDDSIHALEQKLEKLGTKYRETTGSNPMEFFNRLEMDANYNSQSGTEDRVKKNGYDGKGRIKKLQNLIKNSNGEFFLEEKDRFFRYEDYRLIDAYIPEVSKCLDLYRDCILSPDDLTKRSLTFYYEDFNLSTDDDEETNDELTNLIGNLNNLKKKYKLERKFKNDIREGCQLGDIFYLLMPFNIGYSKILKENDDMFVNEDIESDLHGEYITESMMGLDDDDDFIALFEDNRSLSKKSKKAEENEMTKEQAKKDIVNSLNNNVIFFKDPTDLLSERKKENNISRDIKNIDMAGSIFKKIPPENIVALELDEQILGYIYIEKNNINLRQTRVNQRNQNPNSLRSGNTGSSINTSDSLGYGGNDVFNSRYDYLSRDQSQIKSKYQLITSIFVKGISKKINKDFLKRNVEFRDLIYSLVHEEYILKKEVKMTFIEPQYIHHLSLNSNNIYGTSKMAKCLFFSKIYLAVLLTNLMQKIIRGRDKRAFYIETGLDDDVEGAVQGFIRDIKSKELSSGHLKNITTILNSVGAFEDYYIPLVDGQESVRIDTVQGMDVDIDNEFLQQLKKSIITGMNVPSTYIDASSEIDFARTLTMSNNPFVRAIINDQDEFGEFFSNVIRELYRNEYGNEKKKRRRRSSKVPTKIAKNKISEISDVNIDSISIRFPTPIYLVLGNTNEQIQNSQNIIEFITSYYFPDDPTGQNNSYDRELQKAKFKKRLAKQHFLQTMDWKQYDKIFEDIIIESNKEAIESTINFTPEAKKQDELDDLEDDDFT